MPLSLKVNRSAASASVASALELEELDDEEAALSNKPAGIVAAALRLGTGEVAVPDGVCACKRRPVAAAKKVMAAVRPTLVKIGVVKCIVCGSLNGKTNVATFLS